MGKQTSTQDKSTSVTTNTTTTTRDVGLTGANYVDAVAIQQIGAIEKEKIAAASRLSLAKEDTARIGAVADSLNKVIGQGGKVLDIVSDQSSEILGTTYQAAGNILTAVRDYALLTQEGINTSAELSSGVITTQADLVGKAQDAQNVTSQFTRGMIIVGAILAGGFALKQLR